MGILIFEGGEFCLHRGVRSDSRLMMQLFDSTVSAMAYSLVREECRIHSKGRESELNRVVAFTLGQRGRMPDWMGLAFVILTLGFCGQSLLFYGALFNRLNHEQRWEQILAWRNSRLGVRRNFIRFYESLAVLGWYSLRDDRA